MVMRFVYRKSDGRFITGGAFDAQPPMVGDPPEPDYVNYGVVEFGDADQPSQTDVFDATLGKRPMTEAERLAAFPPPKKRLSRFEFMSLLTTSERVALRNRAATDTTMADALNMLELVGHVECVPLHPMVAQMLGYVQSLGIMTAERRAAFEAAMAAAAYLRP